MATALARISQPQTVNTKAEAYVKTASGSFAPEREILFLCSKVDLEPEDINRISFNLSLSPDWQYIIAVAHRNGVLPLLCKHLTEHFPHALDGETKRQIADFFREHAQQNIYITGKLVEAIKMLDRAGIPSLAFKGPTLAMKAYRNIALRQFVDLDLLVQPKDFEAAVELFVQNGFRVYSNAKVNLLLINRKKDIGLIGPDGIVRIELHWKLSGSFFAMPFELRRLWNRLEKTTLGGIEINAMPFNDLFVYLCLHGARHGFERLAWICDLCELIRSEENIDWQAVSRHARAYGCGKVVELGLLLAHEFFAVTTDYPGWNSIRRDEILQKAVRQIREKLFAERFSKSEIGDWYLYHLMLKEKKTDRIKLHLHYLFWYLKLALTPNAMDESVFHLPAAFYPLYYVLRPARLIFNRLAAGPAEK